MRPWTSFKQPEQKSDLPLIVMQRTCRPQGKRNTLEDAMLETRAAVNGGCGENEGASAMLYGLDAHDRSPQMGFVSTQRPFLVLCSKSGTLVCRHKLYPREGALPRTRHHRTAPPYQHNVVAQN